MSAYEQGRRIEYKVVHLLAANGYETQRAASSKGVADVIGIKEGQVVLVSCKRSKMPPPAERADLLRVASLLPGLVPLVAIGLPRLTFRKLLGPGPNQWEPWVADEMENMMSASALQVLEAHRDIDEDAQCTCGVYIAPPSAHTAHEVDRLAQAGLLAEEAS